MKLVITKLQTIGLPLKEQEVQLPVYFWGKPTISDSYTSQSCLVFTAIAKKRYRLTTVLKSQEIGFWSKIRT